jgi:hypothetical protein
MNTVHIPLTFEQFINGTHFSMYTVTYKVSFFAGPVSQENYYYLTSKNPDGNFEYVAGLEFNGRVPVIKQSIKRVTCYVSLFGIIFNIELKFKNDETTETK